MEPTERPLFSGGCVVYGQWKDRPKGEGKIIADLTDALMCGCTPDEVEANAALIVKAVNMHERLVEFVREQAKSKRCECYSTALRTCRFCKARALLEEMGE